MKLLLVEDESMIAEAVCRGLISAGYAVDHVSDGISAMELIAQSTYVAIVLDLMLPRMSGLELCRTLRTSGDSTPILMLTARDSVTDRVKGLELGADDYLVKPFEFPELVARIRALVRRDKIHRGKSIQIGHLTLNFDEHRVTVDGELVTLNHREYELLAALAINEGRVLTRDAIQFRVWNNEESFSNIVEVQIRRLRRKIERDHLPKLIHTIQGVGYSLRRPETQPK